MNDSRLAECLIGLVKAKNQKVTFSIMKGNLLACKVLPFAPWKVTFRSEFVIALTFMPPYCTLLGMLLSCLRAVVLVSCGDYPPLYESFGDGYAYGMGVVLCPKMAQDKFAVVFYGIFTYEDLLCYLAA